MAYTLASIRNRVLDDKLDDTSFDPDIVDRFINDTQRSVFNTYALPFQEKEWSGIVAEDEYIFEFPEDYQQTQAMIIVDPAGNIKDITNLYMPWKQFIRTYPLPNTYTNGAPGVWTSHANRLRFTHKLDDDYTLSLWYLKKPTELSADGDIPEIPSEFEEVLVLGAYYRVLERNEDFDLAAFYKNGDYTDELEKMVGRYGQRQTGKTMPMVQPLRTAGGRRSGRR